jgi:segregation and condensation protein A
VNRLSQPLPTLVVESFVPDQNGFSVQQDAFSGTLGELAYALREGQLSPRHLDLRALVGDYLTYFREVAGGDLTLASEALPQVAQVIELKLRLLLPRPPRDEGDDDLLEEVLEAVYLLEQLEDAIGFLRRRRSERRVVLSASTPRPDYPRPERPLDIGVERLAELAARRRILGYFEVAVERFTLAQAMARLWKGLRRRRRGMLFELFEARDWPTRTVVFAAMLELVRGGEVRAEQADPYGAIELEMAASRDRVEDAA